MRIAILSCLVVLATACTPMSGVDQPHVLIIMADDLGWNDVGYHDSEIRTPTLDGLAAQGMQLERFYAHPYCSPTRSALMTGQAPLRNGILRPIAKNLAEGLSLDRKIMPQYFKEAGYQTTLVGKWHLGHRTRAQQPTARGFDHFYGHVTGGIGFWNKVHGGGYDWQRNGETVRDGRYSTHLITEEAVRLISERANGKPLFMLASFNAPHLPNEAPEVTIDRYAGIEDPHRRTHAAMVSELDSAVSDILDALKQAGIYDNTIIWFLSDNGGLIKRAMPDLDFAMVDRDGQPLVPGAERPELFIEFLRINSREGGSSNKPLQRGKGSVFEGGIRVPSFVSWPGRIESNVLDAMITVEDVMPTLLALAGVSEETNTTRDGANQSDVLLGKGDAIAHPYIAAGNDGVTYISWPWKLIQPVGGGSKLFNLDDDPTELRDLAAERPQIVARLARSSSEFPRGDPINGPIGPDFIWDPDFFGGDEDRAPWADVVE